MSYLAKATKGKSVERLRILVYGPEKVGKTSLVSGAPSPLFIDTNGGTSRMNVNRVGANFTWPDVLGTITELRTTDHDYQTLILDELGHLQSLSWDQIQREDKKKQTVGEMGYGRGFDMALDKWRGLMYELDLLQQEKNMHAIFVGHSETKSFKNPEGGDYDRYEVQLHKKVAGLLKQQCDDVFFVKFEEFSTEHDKDKRNKGISTGERVIHTIRKAAFDAGNRHDLPETMPFDWDNLWTAMTVELNAEDLQAKLGSLIPEMPESDQERARGLTDKYATDPVKLAKVLSWVKGTIQS